MGKKTRLSRLRLPEGSALRLHHHLQQQIETLLGHRAPEFALETYIGRLRTPAEAAKGLQPDRFVFSGFEDFNIQFCSSLSKQLSPSTNRAGLSRADQDPITTRRLEPEGCVSGDQTFQTLTLDPQPSRHAFESMLRHIAKNILDAMGQTQSIGLLGSASQGSLDEFELEIAYVLRSHDRQSIQAWSPQDVGQLND